MGLSGYLLFLLACPQSINYREKTFLFPQSHNAPASIHNNAIQLVSSSSQPGFRIFSGKHLDSLWGMWTHWQSRNLCIFAFFQTLCFVCRMKQTILRKKILKVTISLLHKDGDGQSFTPKNRACGKQSILLSCQQRVKRLKWSGKKGLILLLLT